MLETSAKSCVGNSSFETDMTQWGTFQCFDIQLSQLYRRMKSSSIQLGRSFSKCQRLKFFPAKRMTKLSACFDSAKSHNADIFRPDLAILCDFKKCPHGFFCLSHLRIVQTLPKESKHQLKIVSAQGNHLIATTWPSCVPTATPLWSCFFRGDLRYNALLTDRASEKQVSEVCCHYSVSLGFLTPLLLKLSRFAVEQHGTLKNLKDLN